MGPRLRGDDGLFTYLYFYKLYFCPPVCAANVSLSYPAMRAASSTLITIWCIANWSALTMITGSRAGVVKGLVFKSHGGANAYAFGWALQRAYDAAKYDVQEQLSALIAELMPTSPGQPTTQA